MKELNSYEIKMVNGGALGYIFAGLLMKYILERGSYLLTERPENNPFVSLGEQIGKKSIMLVASVPFVLAGFGAGYLVEKIAGSLYSYLFGTDK